MIGSSEHKIYFPSSSEGMIVRHACGNGKYTVLCIAQRFSKDIALCTTVSNSGK